MVEGDLRQQTLELLSGNVFREPSRQELGVLEPIGYDTVLSTIGERLYMVVCENQDHFEEFETDIILRKPWVRDYKQPALTVVLRSHEIFLADSFNQPQSVQLQMTEIENKAVQELVPDARAIMLPASTLAQLDRRSLEEKGRVLFKDKFARALDIFGSKGCHVGRTDAPGSHLKVWDGNREQGSSIIGVLAAVVFIQK